MSNQVELVSIEQHSKYVLEKVLVNVSVGMGSEDISVKKKNLAAASRIEKLYCDPTKIISVIVPSGSESLFETDDEDDDECTLNLRENRADSNDIHANSNKSSNASCKETTSPPGNEAKKNLKINLQKSVIKEVLKPCCSSDGDFKKEGGQYSLLHNEYLISKMVPNHRYILKPSYFEEYDEGAFILMPYAPFGDADVLSQWQFNTFKTIQIQSMELHKLLCLSQSYEYQQPHLQEKVENQCENIQRFIKEEMIQKNLRDCVKVIRVLAKQVGEALYFLHNKCDIAHNDIKPDNIYISEYDIQKNKFQFQLADFGYSRKGEFSSNKDAFEFFNRKNKRFFSPELLHLIEGQLDNSQPIVDEKKCDIYAFGLSLYEILAGGFFPFKDDLNDPLFIKYMKKAITIQELMQTFLPYFSQVTEAHQMIDLLSHMMDPEPTTRYSINEVLQHPWLKSLKLSTKQPIKSVKSLSKFEVDN